MPGTGRGRALIRLYPKQSRGSDSTEVSGDPQRRSTTFLHGVAERGRAPFPGRGLFCDAVTTRAVAEPARSGPDGGSSSSIAMPSDFQTRWLFAIIEVGRSRALAVIMAEVLRQIIYQDEYEAVRR